MSLNVAYYNEHDGYCAQWLRNLIGAGLIAPGDVDERDIRDVRPDDLRGYAQCHFFAGIGGWSYALRLAGWPDDRPVWTGSCPCQPFSTAGRGAGFADERHLWPAWQWLIAQCDPEHVFGEQVASKDGLAWLDLVSTDMEGAGYTCGSLAFPAAGVGSPQARHRLWFVADPGASGWRALQRAGEAHGRPAVEPVGHGDPGVVALAPGQPGRLPADARRARASETVGHGEVGVVGDPEHGRREGRHAPGREAGATLPPSPAGVVGDACGERGRRHPGAVPRAEEEGARGGRGAGHIADEPFPASAARVLGDALGAGPQERSIATVEPGALRIQGSAFGAAEPVRGFWRGADWLYHRDGKYRAVRPGSFPLAHGVPARVGRLRAYGNAIVPQVAAEFITACLETEAARLAP